MCNLEREQMKPTRLRDTPATELELYLMQKHRAAGTAPKMPAWYKPTTLPKSTRRKHWPVYVSRLGTVPTDPRIGYSFPGGQTAKQRWRAGAKLFSVRADKGLMTATEDTRVYVAAFCKLNGLVS